MVCKRNQLSPNQESSRWGREKGERGLSSRTCIFHYIAPPSVHMYIRHAWRSRNQLWLTSTVCRASCWVLRCVDAGTARRVCDEPPAPTPWRRSSGAWCAACASPLRWADWASGWASSRIPSTGCWQRPGSASGISPEIDWVPPAWLLQRRPLRLRRPTLTLVPSMTPRLPTPRQTGIGRRATPVLYPHGRCVTSCWAFALSTVVHVRVRVCVNTRYEWSRYLGRCTSATVIAASRSLHSESRLVTHSNERPLSICIVTPRAASGETGLPIDHMRGWLVDFDDVRLKTSWDTSELEELSLKQSLLFLFEDLSTRLFANYTFHIISISLYRKTLFQMRSLLRLS